MNNNNNRPQDNDENEDDIIIIDQDELRDGNDDESNKDANKRVLYVPCLGWATSPNTKGNVDGIKLQKINFPIIIFWMEPLPPSMTKKSFYYAFLDQDNAPLRSNCAQLLRRATVVAGEIGFAKNPTNTYKYIYAVPKMFDFGDIGNEKRFIGKNLNDDYISQSAIPSYIASADEIEDQIPYDHNMVGPGETIDNRTNRLANRLLNDVRDDRNNNNIQQWWYRNKIIDTCAKFETLQLSPDCSTKSRHITIPGGQDAVLFSDYAKRVGWDLYVFLQYVPENTERNFRNANQGFDEFASECRLPLKSLEQLMLNEWGFQVENGKLVYPSNYRTFHVPQGFGDVVVPGLRPPHINWALERPDDDMMNDNYDDVHDRRGDDDYSELKSEIKDNNDSDEHDENEDEYQDQDQDQVENYVPTSSKKLRSTSSINKKFKSSLRVK